MKTAISLPDELFSDAERIAKSLGIPRSQLFAKALEEFIDRHRRERITGLINGVYDGIAAIDESGLGKIGLESMRELTKNDSW